jgi:hypothetical protein
MHMSLAGNWGQMSGTRTTQASTIFPALSLTVQQLAFHCPNLQQIRDRYPALLHSPIRSLQQFLWRHDSGGNIQVVNCFALRETQRQILSILRLLGLLLVPLRFFSFSSLGSLLWLPSDCLIYRLLLGTKPQLYNKTPYMLMSIVGTLE